MFAERLDMIYGKNNMVDMRFSKTVTSKMFGYKNASEQRL